MIPELLELNQIRLDADLSYPELARRLGISQSALMRTMRRDTEPRDRTLHKIRRFITAHKAGKRRPQ